MVDCETIGAYSGIRTMFQTSCRTAVPGTSSLFTSTTCAEVVADICTATTGANANPFSNICSATTHSGQRATFATSCVGATAPLNNGATCPAAVIECANNPFGSTCVLNGTTTVDPAYNAQRTAVLGLCDNSAKIIANVGNRCDDAVEDVACLRDPFQTCSDLSQLNLVAGGNGATHFANLKADRLTYCGTGNNINSQTNICRTTFNSGTAHCLANPFDSPSCDSAVGADGTAQKAYRVAREAHCLSLGGAAAKTNGSINHAGIGSTAVNLCYRATSQKDAVGQICHGHLGSTTDKGRDPFSAFCVAIDDYNGRRKTRLEECAGGAAKTSAQPSETYAVSTVLNCNYARQVTYCANNTTALDGSCGTINTATKWNEIPSGNHAPMAFVNSDAGDTNKFVPNNYTFPSTNFEYVTDVSGTTTVTDAQTASAAVNFGAGTAATKLPSVTGFSARRKAVPAGDAVTTLGQPLTMANGQPKVGGATQNDIDTSVPSTPRIEAGEQRFYATIHEGDVGRPVFNRVDGTATAIWNGQIHWVGNGTAVVDHTGARSNFKMEVDFANRTIEGAVSINATPANPGLGNHLVIDGDYTGAGIITGTTYIRSYTSTYNSVTPNIDANGTDTSPGFLSGIIGHKGAAGVFISEGNTNGYAGGFVVCSTTNAAYCQ